MNKIKGFSMIEVIISILIIGATSLGAISYFSGAQKLNTSQREFLSTQNVAHNFSVSMLAHISQDNQNTYTNASINNNFNFQTCSTTACNSVSIANRDLFILKDILTQSLNNPSFRIAVNTDIITISVFWDDIFKPIQSPGCRQDAQPEQSCIIIQQMVN